MKLNQLKHGEYFTLKPISEPKDNQVWVLQEFDRSEKKYFAVKFSDISVGRYFASGREVFTDFIF